MILYACIEKSSPHCIQFMTRKSEIYRNKCLELGEDKDPYLSSMVLFNIWILSR